MVWVGAMGRHTLVWAWGTASIYAMSPEWFGSLGRHWLHRFEPWARIGSGLGPTLIQALVRVLGRIGFGPWARTDFGPGQAFVPWNQNAPKSTRASSTLAFESLMAPALHPKQCLFKCI